MNKKAGIVNIGIFILMLIFICLLIFTIITLVKNKDIIMSDSLVYGMKVHNFTSCSCFDSQGNNWESTLNGFINKQDNLRKWVNLK